jgi:hypothetical protein
LKRLIRVHLDIVLSATIVLVSKQQEEKTYTTVKEMKPATETTAAQDALLQPEEVHLEDINMTMVSSIQEFVAHNFDRRRRTVQLECNNGRNTTLMSRPFSKDVKSFVEEANRSKWIQ